MNKYTERAETYWRSINETQPVPRDECKLKTCLKDYGGGDKMVRKANKKKSKLQKASDEYMKEMRIFE